MVDRLTRPDPWIAIDDHVYVVVPSDLVRELTAQALRDEAARREAEATQDVHDACGDECETPKTCGSERRCLLQDQRDPDAPPPTAPRPHLDRGPGFTHADPAETCCNPMPQAPDLVEGLRERAASYRMGGPSSEHTAAMLDEAADAIEALRAEREQLRTHRDQWRKSYENACQWHAEAIERAEAAGAENKRMREALVQIDALDPEGEVYGLSEVPVRGLVMRMGEIARAALAAVADALTKGEGK